MDAAQRILQRLPPADLEKNVKALGAKLNSPDATEALHQKFPLPLKVVEPSFGADEKPFVACHANRIGDRHYSPWTGKLHPPLQDENKDDTGIPHGDDDDDAARDLRLFELKFNLVWDAYKSLYYGNDAVSSAFLRATDNGGGGDDDNSNGNNEKQRGSSFAGVFVIQKVCQAGSWNSIHYVALDDPGDDKTCRYSVKSSVLLILDRPVISENSIAKGQVDLSATLSKETSKVCKIQKSMLEASHMENLGQLMEGNEIDLRSQLERVSIPKTQEVMDGLQQKKSKAQRPVGVNPLMGMIMDSSVLKKKLAGQVNEQ